MTIQVMNTDMVRIKFDIVTKNTCISPFIEGVEMFCENMTEKWEAQCFFYI